MIHGGTDFCAPLNEALRLMEEKGFENAEFSNISAVDDEIVADVKLSYEANIWHDGKSEKTLGVIDFTFTLKASDDNWKISAITREGDEEWIEDASTICL